MEDGKRYRQVRDFLGFKQQELDKELDLKQDKSKNIETGKHKVSIDLAMQIEQKYSINPWWLLTGNGSMLLNNDSQTPTTKQQSQSDNLIQINYYDNIYASAGGGAYNDNTAPTLMAFDKNFLKNHIGLSSFNNIHIITATGDSMEPTISAGELLFISPISNENGYIKNGSIYIIRIEDTILVKRVSKDNINKTITLISDNSVYDKVVINSSEIDNCEIVGRVIGQFNGL